MSLDVCSQGGVDATELPGKGEDPSPEPFKWSYALGIGFSCLPLMVSELGGSLGKEKIGLSVQARRSQPHKTKGAATFHEPAKDVQVAKPRD